jgi:hypothetical protein
MVKITGKRIISAHSSKRPWKISRLAAPLILEAM